MPFEPYSALPTFHWWKSKAQWRRAPFSRNPSNHHWATFTLSSCQSISGISERAFVPFHCLLYRDESMSVNWIVTFLWQWQHSSANQSACKYLPKFCKFWAISFIHSQRTLLPHLWLCSLSLPFSPSPSCLLRRQWSSFLSIYMISNGLWYDAMIKLLTRYRVNGNWLTKPGHLVKFLFVKLENHHWKCVNVQKLIRFLFL